MCHVWKVRRRPGVGEEVKGREKVRGTPEPPDWARETNSYTGPD